MLVRLGGVTYAVNTRKAKNAMLPQLAARFEWRSAAGKVPSVYLLIVFAANGYLFARINGRITRFFGWVGPAVVGQSIHEDCIGCHAPKEY